MSRTLILPIGSGGGIDPSEKLAKNLSLTIDEDYVISANLVDQDGAVLGDVQTIDLPLESVVVNGRYDEQTKSIILTLDNGNEITIPVGALVSGLVTTEQLQGLQAVVETKADSADLTALQGVVDTKAAQADLNALQAVVDTKANSSDLTALQAVVDTKADSSDLSSLQGVVGNLQSVVDTKADSADLSSLQGVVGNLQSVVETKQDALTAGDNITIVDNVISAQGGGGGNAWYGTQAQFDALGTYDEDTDYFISGKIDWTEIKHRPDMSRYATNESVDAKDTVLDNKIAAKMEASFMTEEEFTQITPLEGANYFIEGTTRALTFTFADQTTETINFVVE